MMGVCVRQLIKTNHSNPVSTSSLCSPVADKISLSLSSRAATNLLTKSIKMQAASTVIHKHCC